MSRESSQRVSTSTGNSFYQKKSPDSHIQYKDVFIYVPFIHEVEKLLRVPVILYDQDDDSNPTRFSSDIDFRKEKAFLDNHYAKISKRPVFRRNTRKSVESQPIHRSLIQMFLYNKHVSQLSQQNAIHLPLGYFTVSDYKRLQMLKNKPWETICYRPVIPEANTDLYRPA